MSSLSNDNILKLREISMNHPIFLSDPDSLYYFAGFTTPGSSFTGLILEPTGMIHFVVRDLEATNLMRTDFSVHVYTETDGSEIVVSLLAAYRTAYVEVDSPRFKMSLYEGLKATHELVDVSKQLKLFRSVKSTEEIAYMKVACTYVQSAYKNALLKLTSGMKETELAGLLSMEKMKAGSEWTTYPEFVASGKSGCIGHKPASRNLIESNQVLFMEIGAAHNRYHAAKMHTVFVDGTPPEWYVRLERAIRDAVQVGTNLCKSGARGKDVDAAMRRLVESCLDDMEDDAPSFCMQRRSAYSIGVGNNVDWTDASFFANPTSNDKLSENMVLHVIPWVHIPGTGAMGFSDIVQVGNTGGTSLFAAP